MFCCDNNFFYDKKVYSQCCTYCNSKMSINSTRYCDKINTNDKNFNSNAIYAKSENDYILEDKFDILKNSYNKDIENQTIVSKEEDIINILDRIDDEIEQLDKIKKVNYEKNTFYYKNYRRAMCLNCKENYDMNFKQKYYCLWGLLCYKTVDNYRDKF